ncbi:MAG: GGDEF domain-containing protein [Muribaculaceae bacterium]|nr:GGDEF domain-containing protein [Muribaculaceae bacterium]
MKFFHLNDITRLLFKDTGEANESPKFIAVIRILVLSMLFYIAINSIIYISILNNTGITILLISFAMFLAIFIMTYHSKSKYVTCILNIGTLAWVAVNVYYFGWDVGVQHFIVVLLILCFFTGYSHYGFKTLYAIALFGFRLYLYHLCRNTDAVVTLSSGTTYLMQIINTAAIFWCISVISYVYSKDSQTLEGKLVNYNNKLIEQANTDTLTGLYNRRRAMDYLNEVLTPSATSCISLCICDIDFFKKVNDTYGHDMGDVVLKSIARTMKATLLGQCLIARWGGEEFLLVFPESNGDHALILLETLRKKIKALKFDAKDKTFSVSMTFGLTEYDFHSDINTIIKEADEKLYRGKENGRDQIVY